MIVMVIHNGFDEDQTHKIYQKIMVNFSIEEA